MFKNSKLSSYKVEKIIECFCLATKKLLCHNRKTVTMVHFYMSFKPMGQFVGVVELDESFFGPTRSCRLGRGSTKQPVFGIYERDGRIYTELVSNCSAKTLQKIVPVPKALS